MADQEGQAAVPQENNMMNGEIDVALDDDKGAAHVDFKGATLELNSSMEKEPTVAFSGPGVKPQPAAPANNTPEADITDASRMRRDRPGSTMSRTSSASAGSRTSFSSAVRKGDCLKEAYFCTKDGSFEASVEVCRARSVDKELDGEITGAWLLTEIDHWDHEREKLVILTDNSLLIIKFDFITQKVKELRRVFLHTVNLIHVGNLTYPQNSIMTRRDYGGVRVGWGDMCKVSFDQRWNPFSTDIPYTTLAHHKLIYNDNERETATFNVDDFYQSLAQAVTQAIKHKNPSQSLTVSDGPIVIESYASLSSLIFNQSHLGYNRDRNGLSF